MTRALFGHKSLNLLDGTQPAAASPVPTDQQPWCKEPFIAQLTVHYGQYGCY